MLLMITYPRSAFNGVCYRVQDIITPIFGLANNRNLDEMFLVIRCGKTCQYPTIALAQADGAGTRWDERMRI